MTILGTISPGLIAFAILLAGLVSVLLSVAASRGGGSVAIFRALHAVGFDKSRARGYAMQAAALLAIAIPSWSTFTLAGGAPTTSSNLANILITTYGRSGYIPAHERSMAKFYSETESWTAGGKPVGAEHKWGIRTKDSHAAGAVAESGDVPTFNPPAFIQASLTAKTVAASVAWSDFFLWVSQAEGTIQAVTGINDHVKMTVRNFMSALNRHSLGHGTGRMAVVESATSSSTTVPVRNPEGAWQLRPGMMVGFYDTDTGGSLQGAVETIQSVNYRARTFVIGNARSLTAGWGIYKATSTSATEYGIVPMGLRGINDNGTLAASLFGQTRSSNPILNATVITSGALQSYSEKLVRQGIDAIGDANDMEPDEIWCNTGIVAEHYNFLSGSRIWSMGAGNAVPNYPIGAKGLPVFVNGDKEVPFRVDRDLPARELHIICKQLYRKHVLREPNWVGDDIGVEGSSSPYLMQAPGAGTSTYALQKIAAFAAALNFGHLMPIAGTKIDNVADEQKAGDS
jgi:hypothetical protein